MTLEEAKAVLKANRPFQPRNLENKKLQTAIDIAIHSIEFHEEYNRTLRGENK